MAAYFAEAEPTEWPTGDEPVEIPTDRKIVSATTYGMYTKDPTSDQDAVIRATLYWDLDNDECYAIRFTEPLTPFMDTGATSGWACVQDEATLEALGDNVIHLSIPATEYGEAVEADYAKYIQIGDIVWTGEAGSIRGAVIWYRRNANWRLILRKKGRCPQTVPSIFSPHAVRFISQTPAAAASKTTASTATTPAQTFPTAIEAAAASDSPLPRLS